MRVGDDDASANLVTSVWPRNRDNFWTWAQCVGLPCFLAAVVVCSPTIFCQEAVWLKRRSRLVLAQSAAHSHGLMRSYTPTPLRSTHNEHLHSFHTAVHILLCTIAAHSQVSWAVPSPLSPPHHAVSHHHHHSHCHHCKNNTHNSSSNDGPDRRGRRCYMGYAGRSSNYIIASDIRTHKCA